MLILIQIGNTRRLRWLPWFRRENDGQGVWYAEAKWLCFVLVFYSSRMGEALVTKFNQLVNDGTAVERAREEGSDAQPD